MMSETQIPRTPRRGDITIRRRPVPVVVARRWAVTWAASIALVVALRTVGHAPFGWMAAYISALPAHPTSMLHAAAVDADKIGLALLGLAVIVALAGPVLIPVLATVHVLASWVWGHRGHR